MRFFLICLFSTALANAEDVSLTAPSKAIAGSKFNIGWSGDSQSLDMITVVAKGTDDGEYMFSKYPSREASPMSFIAPSEAGDYEIRYLRYANPGYTVMARQAMSLEKQTAVALVAPASITAGQKFKVSWSGPNASGDEIRLVTPGGAGRILAKTAAKGRTAVLEAPNQRGDYLLQYVRSGETQPLGSVTLSVGASAQTRRAPVANEIPVRRGPVTRGIIKGVGAVVTAPDSVMAGEPIDVNWTGPDNKSDYLALTISDNPQSALSSARTNRGNPARLTAPDEPGRYRIHYVAGSRDLSLGSTYIVVTASGEQGELWIRSAEDTAFQVYDLQGAVAGAGSANDDPMTLSAGDYVVRVDGRVVQVRVRAGGTTDLNLK